MRSEPTPAQRRQYADYDVEIREAQNNHVRIAVEDGEVIRFYARAHRIPSLKKFVVFVYLGATDRDRRRAEQWAAELPGGGWAEFPLAWFKRRRPDGSYLWKQEIGVIAPDPFAQLELEMMIDAGSEVHS